MSDASCTKRCGPSSRRTKTCGDHRRSSSARGSAWVGRGIGLISVPGDTTSNRWGFRSDLACVERTGPRGREPRSDWDLAVAGVRHAAARGLTLRAAVTAVASQAGVSERTLWRWLSRSEGAPEETGWRPSDEDLVAYARWCANASAAWRERREAGADVPALRTFQEGIAASLTPGPAGRAKGGGAGPPEVRRLPPLGARGAQRPLGGRPQAARHRRAGQGLRAPGAALADPTRASCRDGLCR